MWEMFWGKEKILHSKYYWWLARDFLSFSLCMYTGGFLMKEKAVIFLTVGASSMCKKDKVAGRWSPLEQDLHNKEKELINT